MAAGVLSQQRDGLANLVAAEGEMLVAQFATDEGGIGSDRHGWDETHALDAQIARERMFAACGCLVVGFDRVSPGAK
jgi:hypothetical protein